jgi:hypothetical protein
MALPQSALSLAKRRLTSTVPACDNDPLGQAAVVLRKVQPNISVILAEPFDVSYPDFIYEHRETR